MENPSVFLREDVGQGGAPLTLALTSNDHQVQPKPQEAAVAFTVNAVAGVPACVSLYRLSLCLQGFDPEDAVV